MTLLASSPSSLGNKGAGYLDFFCSKPVPCITIIPFLDLTDLDAACRVNHAFKETLLAASFIPVSNLYKRALCIILSTEELHRELDYTKKKLQEIISLTHSQAMENILSLQEKPGGLQAGTPEQLSLAVLEYVRRKGIFPLTLYQRLILATPRNLVYRLIYTFDPDKNLEYPDFLPRLSNLFFDFVQHNIPMAPKWALVLHLKYEDGSYQKNFPSYIPTPGINYSDERIAKACNSFILGISKNVQTASQTYSEFIRRSYCVCSATSLMFATMLVAEISSDKTKDKYFVMIARECLNLAKIYPHYFPNLLNILPYLHAVKLANLIVSKLGTKDLETADKITTWVYEKNRARQESVKALEQSVARAAAQIKQRPPTPPSVQQSSTDPTARQISCLSYYWNTSILFRIFSILSLGLLPLAVFLWELCCKNTARQTLPSS